MRFLPLVLLMIFFASCQSNTKKEKDVFTGQDGEVKLVVLDPGHFHAALVQKYPVSQINSDVHVYAPKGKELDSYLNTVDGFNKRDENPTSWNQVVYSGDDYLEKMLSDHEGNVVILAGNNQKKIDYVLKSLESGFNVLADKPLIINPESFPVLEQAYASAKKEGVLLADMMTERYEVTNALQGMLINTEEIFGRFIDGEEDKPAIETESVHHFLKTVSGSPLVRPAWYYNVEQQGEGIVDVTTHLIDLISYNCFKEQAIDYKSDIEVVDADRYPTKLLLSDYTTSTGEGQFPDYLQKYITNDTLNVYANGYIKYKIKGVPVKIDVRWDLKAPQGGGDTHRFIARGTRSDIMILQGKEQKYKPEIYIKRNAALAESKFDENLNAVILRLQNIFPGISVENVKGEKGLKHIIVPDELRKGHEAHFSQVIQNYIGYLQQGEMPAWEVSNTIAKYYITTKAVEMARKK